MHDALGERMKANYESRFQTQLPRRTYTILRIDGKAFHTYTRPLEKPFDERLGDAMDSAAASLCKQMMGCQLAYGQSDEYSFLLTDFATEQTEAWFDGKVQKIISVAASIFTAEFLAKRFSQGDHRVASFDARVFCIPDRVEVENYFIWRQQDAERNSLNMLASEYYSHKELHDKGSKERHDMLHAKGVNWNDLLASLKRGRVVRRVERSREVTYTHKKTGEIKNTTVEGSFWDVDHDIPVFTRDRNYLERIVPAMESEVLV